jgi:hypothetical protein
MDGKKKDDAKMALHTQLGLVMQQKPSDLCGVDDKLADWTKAVSEINIESANKSPSADYIPIKRDPVINEKIMDEPPPHSSSAEVAAFMEKNVRNLEKQLRSMRLRHAHAFADSANRIANNLANSDLHASSAFFEKFLCDNEASPRRLLQLAVESDEVPQVLVVYADCAAMSLRLKELEEDEQDMHERDVVAKNVMYAAFAASLRMGEEGRTNLST